MVQRVDIGLYLYLAGILPYQNYDRHNRCGKPRLHYSLQEGLLDIRGLVVVYTILKKVSVFSIHFLSSTVIRVIMITTNKIKTLYKRRVKVLNPQMTKTSKSRVSPYEITPMVRSPYINNIATLSFLTVVSSDSLDV